jgi:Na+-transporting NADH:ubiquinone oxidoreductase subunit A
VSVLPEGRERRFMGWLSPGTDKHSVMGIYLSQLFGSKRFAMDTSTNGSRARWCRSAAYEKVMPLDILADAAAASLVSATPKWRQKLGALELDEEDLALCSYVCPGKYEFGPILRDNLTRIEKEA